MKTYKEAVRAVAKKLANTQYHLMMGGAQRYKVYVDDPAQILAIVYEEPIAEVEARLQKHLDKEFLRLTKG